MEAYLQAFVNFKQNDWARLLSMAEFAYKNAKNASTGHILFKLDFKYHPRIFYKKDLNSRSKSKATDELAGKLRDLIATCRENFHRAYKLHKQAHDKAWSLKAMPPVQKFDCITQNQTKSEAGNQVFWAVSSSTPDKKTSFIFHS